MGAFSDSLEYDYKRTILKMYEKIIEYKLELLRNEKYEIKNDQIEVEIFELIHTIADTHNINIHTFIIHVIKFFEKCFSFLHWFV